MLSNTCKYAIRAVTYLAVKADANLKFGLKQISEELQIPSPFLGKILQMLAKNKLLLSAKGPNGGFSLAKKPSEVSIYDIIKIVDGIDVFDNCLFGYKVCEHAKDKRKVCPVHPKTGPVLDQLEQLYKEQTLDILVEDFKNNEKNLRY